MTVWNADKYFIIKPETYIKLILPLALRIIVDHCAGRIISIMNVIRHRKIVSRYIGIFILTRYMDKCL